MFKEDHEFPIHHAQQEVRTVAFQNHLQSPGIQLAKKCHSMHCAGSQSRVHNLVSLFFAGKTINLVPLIQLAMILNETQIQPACGGYNSAASANTPTPDVDFEVIHWNGKNHGC